jgi:predicted DsbA family dithiol-disulfide isomerase
MDEPAPTTTLEIVSDVVCPWCYIGKRRLAQALELLGTEIPLTVRWKPYELNPTMPTGGMDRKNYYASKFGSEQHADDLIANITANAHDDGLAMDYSNIKCVPNTRIAHRLIWFSEQFDHQDAVVDGLFQAYFVDGHNIENTSVLIEIAVDAGLERTAVARFLDSDEASILLRLRRNKRTNRAFKGFLRSSLTGAFCFPARNLRKLFRFR